jgi:hypothetical protein
VDSGCNATEGMKIAAIYCVWFDGMDLLPYSVNNILPVVDGVIIIWSNYSNHGEYKPFTLTPADDKVKMYQCEPAQFGNAHQSEREKRNFGLDKARQLGFTHFIMLDADEFYEQSDFQIEKDYIEKNNTAGTVCRTQVYFKKPTYFLPDHTLVPFIHKITPTLRFQHNNKTYPFTYDKDGNAHIDPTRRLNITDGVEWSNITMHHFSWLRSDYNLKIENSVARKNLKASTIYADLQKAAPGVYNDFYRAEIKECENIFNLPDL